MEQPRPLPSRHHSARPAWARFVGNKTVRVLLVETDKSTRTVITALLRGCKYEVVAAEDGWQAWAFLQVAGVHSNIDLVLTEADLSGIELLDRVMDHGVRKTPVIMMSHSNSEGTVFSCLSKGAVGFLQKPIRKQEVNNLWQHVWRWISSSCLHQTQYSGTRSGCHVQALKYTKTKSGHDSNSNNKSNDRSDDAGMGLNARNGSDNGSDTQAMFPYQSTETPNGTCALVFHRNPDTCSTRRLPGEIKGKGLEIEDPTHLNTDDESCPNGSSIKLTDWWCEYLRWNNSNASTMEKLEEPIVVATADLIGSMAKNMDAQHAASATDAPNCFSEVPSVDLSLKRPRSTGYYENSIQNILRNVLRLSDRSALARIFSRNNNMSVVSNQGGTEFMGSRLPHGNSSKDVKTDSPYNMKSTSDDGLMKQGKYANRDNNMTSLELSLKMPRSNRDGANAIQEDDQRNVLTKSYLSTFTRYKTYNQDGVGGLLYSCSLHAKNSEAGKTDCSYIIKQSSDASLMQEGKDTNHENVMPSPGLSLKRSRSTGYGANASQEEQSNVLTQSDLSALTRYNTSNKGGVARLLGHGSPQGKNSEDVQTDYPYNMEPASDASLIHQGKGTNCDNHKPSLEWSSKRTRSTEDGANAIQEERRNVLAQSDPLALMRISIYNNMSAVTNQGRAGFMGSCFPHGNSSEYEYTDCPYNMKSISDVSLMMQGKDANRDNNMPSIQLSSKRPTSNGDGANAIREEQRNILTESDPSALTRIFSRNNNMSVVSNHGGAEFMGSCLPHGSSSKDVKSDSPYNMKSSSDDGLMKQGKYANRDNNTTSLELSLKMPRSNGDGANAIQEDHRNVLTKSYLSTFTRYKTYNQDGVGGLLYSCSLHAKNSEAVKTDCSYIIKQSSDSSLMQEGKDTNHENPMPSPGLSLKRSRSTGYGATASQEEQSNVLTQSDMSALTRCNTSNKGGVARLLGSGSPHGKNSEDVQTDYPYNMEPASAASLIHQGNGTNCDNDKPSLEWSSKRTRSTEDGANAIQEEQRNVLAQSDPLALMRISIYNNMSAVTNQVRAGFMGSCFPHGNSSESEKKDCLYNMKSISYVSMMKQGKDANRDDNMPSIQLSSKRPTSNGDGANAIREEQRNILTQSDPSALTRYNTSNKGGVDGLLGICLPHGSTSEAVETGCPYNMKPSSASGAVKQGSDDSGDNKDVDCSARVNVVTKHGGNKVSPVTDVVTMSGDEVERKNAAGGGGDAGQAKSKYPCMSRNDSGGSIVPQSNVTNSRALVEGSNSGSNNNTNNRRGAADEAVGNHRDIALDRFREKKKRRNFEKKVRYEGRKRHAEQRPRDRGQFARRQVATVLER